MPGFNNLLWFMGVVENNIDERLEGRVQVRAFGFHGTVQQIPTRDLPWAIPISGNYDPNYPIPPLNSWVFGFFLDGEDAQQPMLMGMLPTQFVDPINPELNGWGNIDTTDYHLRAMGFRPGDLGQPQRSRLARGESLEQTYVRDAEITKISDVSSASGESWSEPSSAYNAEYPYNRVLAETASGHSIELDDTPGGERIMIYHKSGSFIQVDAAGTTTNKSTNDKYDINESNMHVYVGGQCDIVIMGDAFVKVNGSKMEEIMGDCKTVVHGNYELDVGGFGNINVSDEMQVRGARVGIEAKVEDVDISAGKAANVTGKISTNITSPLAVNISGKESNNIKGKGVYLEGSESISVKAEAVKIGGGSKVSIKGATVAIDDVIQLSNGESDDPDGAPDAVDAVPTQMTEPTSKSVSGMGSRTVKPSAGSAGAANFEDRPDVIQTDFISDCSTDLIDAIASQERFEPRAYWDEKQYSIGYGTKTTNQNEVIDEPEARRRLKERVATDRSFVSSYGKSHGYNWNDCQVDALTSFVYNLGRGGLEQVTNNGTRTNAEIAEKMLEYNGVSRDSGYVVLDGLTKRRKSESDWFKSGSGLGTPTPSSNTAGVMV